MSKHFIVLAYAAYMPRMQYTNIGVYPGSGIPNFAAPKSMILSPSSFFNGLTQQYGISPSGRSSASNNGGNVNNITQAAQQQAFFEAAVAYYSGTDVPLPPAAPLGHQQPVSNSFNKL